MTRRLPSSSPVWPRANGTPAAIGMSGSVSPRPAASTISRLNPSAVGLAGDRLDCETEQSETVVRVLVPCIRLDHGWVLEVGHQLIDVRERTAILKKSGVGAVAHNAGAVRKDLAEGSCGYLRMQAFHIFTDRVVQAQLP